MKFLKILITLTFIYTILGIPLLHAGSSIDPAIRRITLAQGERMYGSVVYKNGENKDIQVSLTPYTYNPKTDEITEDKKNIFLKVDTDTIKVKANSSYNIKYEIFPLSNLPNGSYFNILAITPVTDAENVKINLSISQLVILDIVDPNEIWDRGDFTAVAELKLSGAAFYPIKSFEAEKSKMVEDAKKEIVSLAILATKKLLEKVQQTATGTQSVNTPAESTLPLGFIACRSKPNSGLLNRLLGSWSAPRSVSRIWPSRNGR